MITVRIKRTNPDMTDDLKKRLESATGKEVAVGFPRGKQGLGNPHYKNGAGILLVAIANNYGLGVPRRAFMELAAKNMRKWFPKYMRQNMPAVLEGKVDIQNVRDAAGAAGAELVKESITDGEWKPNAPETVESKGPDKPLIDTGAMRQAATWQVRDRS